MAIELEIIESAGYGSAGDDTLALLRGPILARQRMAAAGLSAAFNADTRVVYVKNHGDAVHIRVNTGSDTTQAAAADTTSIKLRASTDEIAFDLTDAAISGKLDVRAV